MQNRPFLTNLLTAIATAALAVRFGIPISPPRRQLFPPNRRSWFRRRWLSLRL